MATSPSVTQLTATNVPYVIGKIPGYNSNIDNGNNYRSRLVGNLTKVKLTPTGYQINMGALSSDTSPVGIAANLSNMYKVGGSIKGTIPGTTTTIPDALTIWKNMLFSNSKAFQNLQYYNELDILCTNDSTMTETFSNGFGDSAIDDLSNLLTRSGIGKLITTGAKGIQAATTYNSNAMQGLLGAAANVGNKNAVESWAKAISAKALNVKIALPKQWVDSQYDNTLQLMIKLVSPNGHPTAIAKNILEPLFMLTTAAAPITYDGIIMGYPMLWEIKTQGLMDIKLGAITAMTITRGGTETQFNNYGQPLNVDVRLTISPLADYYVTPISLNSSPVGDDIYNNTLALNPKTLYTSMSSDGPNATITI